MKLYDALTALRGIRTLNRAAVTDNMSCVCGSSPDGYRAFCLTSSPQIDGMDHRGDVRRLPYTGGVPAQGSAQSCHLRVQPFPIRETPSRELELPVAAAARDLSRKQDSHDRRHIHQYTKDALNICTGI